MDTLPASENLLVQLYRLARRQQENFVTEAFAHVLRHVAQYEPALAGRVLQWLTSPSLVADEVIPTAVRIRTQYWTAHFGIPDMRIEVGDLVIIIEVKLGSGISYGQVDVYRKAIEAEGHKQSAIVALVGYKPYNELPEGTHVRTWGELGLMLAGEAEQASAVTRYLVGQFVGLLYHLDLMPLTVRSSVSEELLRHRAWADSHPEEAAVTRTRLRSLGKLKAMKHTIELRGVLKQMQHVLSHAEGVRTHRFDSGPLMDQPWIGFNVNDMDYFFFLSLNTPERLTLQRWGRGTGIDKHSFGEGSLGELDVRSDGITRWRHSIDLADPVVGYFAHDRLRQVELIREFFEESFRFAQTLEPPAIAAGS